MISEEYIQELTETELKGTELFLVDVEVKQGNIISVYVDKKEGVTIDECAEINESLESQLDRDKEDFELRVSSPGLNRPLKVMQQYEKNLGQKVEVLYKDGRKIKGTLKEATHEAIVVEQKKKNTNQSQQTTIPFNEMKSTKIDLSF